MTLFFIVSPGWNDLFTQVERSFHIRETVKIQAEIPIILAIKNKLIKDFLRYCSLITIILYLYSKITNKEINHEEIRKCCLVCHHADGL